MTHPFLLGLSLWLCWMLGQFTHGFFKAGSTVKSQLNGIASYRMYFEAFGYLLAWRFFLATMIFMGWQEDPVLLNQVVNFALGFFHVQAKVSILEIPKLPFVAGIFGAFIDFVIDQGVYRLGFQKEIPPIGGVITTSKETTAVTTEQKVTEKTTVVIPPGPKP